MSATMYRIADEPQPSTLERFVVNPMWPFLAMMLVGGWLAIPWFAANSALIGSPTRRKESLVLAAAPVLVGAAVYALLESGALDGLGDATFKQTFRYLMLVVSGVMLICYYWVFTLQSRVFGVWEHFGSEPAPGYVPLVLGFLLDDHVNDLLFAAPAEFIPWALVLR